MNIQNHLPENRVSHIFCKQEIKPFWHYLLAVIFLGLLLMLGGCQASPPKNNTPIQLTLWHGINPPPNRDVFDKLITKFNQSHSDIQIQSLYAGQLDQQLPKVLTAVVGNTPPDILAFYPQITGQFIELGAILPLENWLEKSPIKSEIVPSLFDELQLDGHLWSVPFYTSDIGIFYRPDLFKKAGISQLPKTWDELKDVAKKLTVDKNGDGRPEQYGMLMPFGKGEWTVFTWFPFFASAKGNLIENKRPNLVTPAAISALQLWQDMLKNRWAILSQPERGYEEDNFLQGRVAMQITGPWTNIAKTNVNYAVFPIPKSLTEATVFGTGNMFVMKTTPEREQAALKFLEYVLSEEFQTEWSIGSGFLPVNIKSISNPTYQEVVKQTPMLKVFLDQLPVARARPTVAGYSRISDNLGRAIEAAMLGEPPEKALKKAQERLDLIWGSS